MTFLGSSIPVRNNTNSLMCVQLKPEGPIALTPPGKIIDLRVLTRSPELHLEEWDIQYYLYDEN